MDFTPTHTHTHTHTHSHTKKRVIENLDFLSSSLISVLELKAPAVSVCYGTLNTSHEPYVNAYVCGVYVSINACVKGAIIQFPLTQKKCFSFPVSLSLSLLTQAYIHSEFHREQKTEKKHPFTHLGPCIVMIVILITMSPVFQVFAHSSSL